MKRTKKREQSQPLLAIIGWVGVVAVLLAYMLNSFGVLQTNQPLYFALNLVGSLTLLIEAYIHHDIPPVLLNIIWAIIAMVGLVRFLISF